MKNNTIHMIYVARTSNNRVIMACELYCCLLPQCEALPIICRLGFLIATVSRPGLPGWHIFLRSNSRNLAFLKVVWHEKMVFGMYVIVWHFLAFSDGVGMKKHCLA